MGCCKTSSYREVHSDKGRPQKEEEKKKKEKSQMNNLKELEITIRIQSAERKNHKDQRGKQQRFKKQQKKNQQESEEFPSWISG